VKKLSLTKVFALILVAGIVTGLVVAKRYTANRVENPSSWRSLQDPVPDTSTEEYAIYSTIIDKLHHEDRLRLFLVRDHTAGCLRNNEWCSDKQLTTRLSHLMPQTIDDYVTQNQESAPLSKSFTLQRPAMMLADSDLSSLLVTTKLKVDYSPLSSRKINWSVFYDRYPLAPGFISLSRVGFNSQLNQALVYEEIQANDNGTWGRYIVLTKQSGEWLISHQPGPSGWMIDNKIEAWFPEEPMPSVQHGEVGTLKGRILDAKAEGLDEVQLSLLICGWDIGNLREALQRDTVMLAEVVGKKTFADTDGLQTWYKFKIVEKLSEKPLPKYPTYSWFPDPPGEMKPLNENEFAMVETNGQMEIDGVRVTQRSNSVAYSVGGTYLIFLHLDPAKRVAVRAGTEPTGVFLVDKDGTFKAYIDRPHPLRDQLASQYGNSIANLRKALKTLTPAKRPEIKTSND